MINKKETLIFNLKMSFGFDYQTDSDVSYDQSSESSYSEIFINYNIFELLISVAILFGFVICMLAVVFLIVCKYKNKKQLNLTRNNSYNFHVEDIPDTIDEESVQKRSTNNISKSEDSSVSLSSDSTVSLSSDSSISLSSVSSLKYSSE